VRSWALAVRKDIFERELIGRMSALQIQAYMSSFIGWAKLPIIMGGMVVRWENHPV
jgi:hypothetical protein